MKMRMILIIAMGKVEYRLWLHEMKAKMVRVLRGRRLVWAQANECCRGFLSRLSSMRPVGANGSHLLERSRGKRIDRILVGELTDRWNRFDDIDQDPVRVAGYEVSLTKGLIRQGFQDR